MNQEQKKLLVAQEAIKYIVKNTIIGVGTGSTVNFFIDNLALIKNTIKGCVASSKTTEERLIKHNIKTFAMNKVDNISLYIDGADEADEQLNLIKGGGGALTREKIIASAADKFICIIDDSKLVKILGSFALAVEVIPMASEHVKRQIIHQIGGAPTLRTGFISDNNNLILDIANLKITNSKTIEAKINNIAGVVANGLFAIQGADILLIGGDNGVTTLS